MQGANVLASAATIEVDHLTVGTHKLQGRVRADLESLGEVGCMRSVNLSKRDVARYNKLELPAAAPYTSTLAMRIGFSSSSRAAAAFTYSGASFLQ